MRRRGRRCVQRWPDGREIAVEEDCMENSFDNIFDEVLVGKDFEDVFAVVLVHGITSQEGWLSGAIWFYKHGGSQQLAP